MAKVTILTPTEAALRAAEDQMRLHTGMYLAKVGAPGRLVHFPPTPKVNCRNCAAPPEIEHPLVCRWCLTPH